MQDLDSSHQAPNSKFYKKIFSQIDAGSTPIKSISPNTYEHESSPTKKIIPTLAVGGLREKFKETFIPLFIEVFELRQMIENFHAQEMIPNTFVLGKKNKSPQEILSQLEDIQKNIEESRRWHEGMILQIEKAIREAKDILSSLKEGESKTPISHLSSKFSFRSWIKKIFRRSLS